MALLQVRNFPDYLYEEIGRVARAERRTIAQQTVIMLEKWLDAGASKLAKRREALERSLARDIPRVVMEADVVQMIRDDRDR
ncbi:MAG: hypothetical protein LBG50_04675 [Clostridiales Family XIII bacterium]|jgi:hypothetical protein|nr:hypothetical protein [Clostridiales Family XIII bacterium]